MQVSVLLHVLLHWVCAILNYKKLYYVVRPVLNCESQQFVPVAEVFAVKKLQLPFFKEISNQRDVVLNHSVMKWQEPFLIQLHSVSARLYQHIDYFKVANETSSMERRHILSV